MRIKGKTVISVLVIVVSSFVILFSIIIFLDKTRNILFFPNSKKQVHQEMKELFELLQIGMNKNESLNLIQDFTKNKKFIINDNNNVIQIISPYDYSFTWSWTIYVILNSKNIVQGIAVRPIDDVSYMFCHAPNDKGVIPKKYVITKKNCIN